MMLRFQWDALRRGDHILVHDPASPDLRLRPAQVVLVDTSGRRGHDVGVRWSDGDGADRVVRPGRFAAHFDPISEQSECWRCAQHAAAA